MTTPLPTLATRPVQVPPARALFAQARSIYRTQYVTWAVTAITAGLALASSAYLMAVICLAVGVGTTMVLSARVSRLYRERLDPLRGTGAQTIDDVLLLLAYYQSAVDGPESVRFWWLPPVTAKRAIARRAASPLWAPRANLAWSARIATDRSTVIVPFLVDVLKTARQSWNCPVDADRGAIAVVALRDAWGTDIVRQQTRDAARQSEAAVAWMMLEL